MNPNINVGEALPVVSTIDPQTVANTAKVGDYVDMSLWEQLIFIFALGSMAAETIDASVYEAQDSSGTGAQSLKAATQLAASATANDDSQIVITVRAEDLSDGFTHVAPRLVTGNTTGGPASCVGLGYISRFEPGSDNDLSTVKEIKS